MLRSAPVTPDGKPTADEWATEVIRSNGTDLLAYLARRTSHTDDAADMLANVMLVIWKRRGSIPRGASEARMWSFGVARNALRDYRRQGVRRSRLAEALRTSLATSFGSDQTEPSELLVRADRARDVRAAVASLPERDRELIMLIHWDGFSIAEAADFLRANASTTRTRYARARTRLAGLLGEYRATAALRGAADTSVFAASVETPKDGLS